MLVHHKRIPLQGLEILENLYQQTPNHQGITNSLINAYIYFGIHDKAIDMITNISDNKTDVKSLKFKAWVEHKNGNIEKEKSIWDNILHKHYYNSYEGEFGSLIYRSNRDINISPTDIPLLCVERNEILRLPFFLEHYRSLGVTKFIFVDNDSNDGSFEFLIQQPDCYVFWSNNSYNQAGSGMVWVQYLINKYILENQWYLVIDADEFLVYPNYENNKLDELIKYLDKHNYTAISSYMLDMFPKSLSAQLNITSGDNLINKSPYFYNLYEFNYQSTSPYIKVNGGIFYLLEHKKYLTVTPLLKKSTTPIILLGSRHTTTPANIPKLSSALLHFKFLGDFQNLAKTEIKRKEHAKGGVEYRKYNQMYEKYIYDSFQFTDLPKTTKYKNSQQLVDLGLIQCPDDWKEFIRNEENNAK